MTELRINFEERAGKRMKKYYIAFDQDTYSRWVEAENPWKVVNQVEKNFPYEVGSAKIQTSDRKEALVLLLIKWQANGKVEIQRGRRKHMKHK